MPAARSKAYSFDDDWRSFADLIVECLGVRGEPSGDIVLPEGTEANVQTRVKMGQTSNIYALVKSDGMVRIDLDTSGLMEGSWVQVILF